MQVGKSWCIIHFIMEKVKEYILKNNLIKKGEVIGVGVSGGSDSMALLNILTNLQEELDFEVVGIHINHGIREESRDEEEFVMQKCKSMGVRAYKFKIDANKLAKDKNMSLETAAREGRYEVFKSLLRKDVIDKIALAHHQLDQAETILMHIFRGSGTSGATGMEPIRDKVFIRPILEVSKKEIMDYIMEHSIDYVEDKSNKDTVYNRNFIRNIILPQIIERWPGAETNIVSFGKTLKEDDSFINGQLFDDAVLYEKDVARIPLSYFIYPQALVNRLIIKVLKNIGFVKDFERKHIEMIKEVALLKENGTRVKLPYDITVIREYDYLSIINKFKEIKPFRSEFKIGEIIVPDFGKIIVRKVKEINQKENCLYIDAKKIPKTAEWRYRSEGDNFTKFGGGSKKLKSFMIDKKIPQRLRNCLPILADGNEVLVIAGVEISDKIKVEESKNILEIEVKK